MGSTRVGTRDPPPPPRLLLSTRRVLGLWSMPPVPAAAGPRGAGPRAQRAPHSSSHNCAWRIYQPIFRMRTL